MYMGRKFPESLFDKKNHLYSLFQEQQLKSQNFNHVWTIQTTTQGFTQHVSLVNKH